MINYNTKKFHAIANTSNGETTAETIFNYSQNGNIVTATYAGGNIVQGQLIGIVDNEGNIDMRYQQLNVKGALMTGVCVSKPEIIEGGKIRLHESWQWTCGDKAMGESIIEEID